MTSHFRIGCAQTIATALRENPLSRVPEEESITSGLFPDDLDAACRILSRLRASPAHSFDSYRGEVLSPPENDEEESGQVLTLKKTFVSFFSTLTDAEAREICDEIRQQEFAASQEAYKRQSTYGARMRSIFQKRSEFFGYLVVPPFLWFMFKRALIIVLVVSFMLVVDLIVRPWWRSREERPPEMTDDDYRGWLLDMAAICRRAEGQHKDLIYEWSL